MKLISIVDSDGKEHFVNPEYITSVENYGNYGKVWVVGQSGYHTYSLMVKGDLKALAEKIAA